jgi:cytochrome b
MFKKGHRSYQLHNPAGSSMILVMILLLVILTSSGILVEAVFEFEGVLYFISNLVNDSQAVLIKKIHSLVAHIMLIVIALHIAGVIYSSYAYKVNMPLMMITGKINFFKNKEK